MATAYAAFANGGIGVQPHVIAKVRTANGKLLYARRNASFGRVIEPQYVAMMNEMMQETLLTGTARKAELPGWQAAGKTGTSQDWRDAWFIGYTSYLVAAVWLGNDDNSPTKKVSGGNLPVEIWSRFMKDAHQGVAVAALPRRSLRRGKPPTRSRRFAAARPSRRAGADPAAERPRRGDDRRRSRSAPLRPRPGLRPPGACEFRGPAALRRHRSSNSAPVPPAPIPNVDGQPGQRANDFFNKIFGTL